MTATSKFLIEILPTLRKAGLFCLLVFVAALPSTAAERPVYLGFELPYPKAAAPTATGFADLPIEFDSIRVMTLGISADGRHVSVQLPKDHDEGDLVFVTSLFSYLKDFEFEPARFRGEAVESRIPVVVRFRPEGIIPNLQFVVDENARVLDYDLYSLALSLNDIHPPTLNWFPGLRAVVREPDTSSFYDYALVRLVLDERGRATEITAVRNTLPGFTHQTLTACNWAEFDPARVHDSAVSAEVYVMISFFPELSYPSLPWTRPPGDSLMVQAKMSVSVRPDTLCLLAKPIPRNAYTEKFTLTEVPGASFSSATVLTEVDTLGHARGLRVGSSYEATVRRFRTLVNQLHFYPAITIDQTPVMFAGPLEARFVGSADVRIRFLWLFWQNPALVNYLSDYQ
ncbi:hypothetical protein KQH82_00935 [bacterium]|nr:hypothetical protein [bacterium]